MSNSFTIIGRLRWTFALLATICAAPSAARSENILLLIGDDLHVSNIGAYNSGPNSENGNPPPTPNIDALAASGVLFRNAWSNPECSPTRAGFFTGRHAFRTGVGTAVIQGSNVLSLSETTIAEVLATGAVPCGLLGKWHLGTAGIGGPSAPNLAGWGHYAGGLQGAVSDYYQWTRTVNGVQATCFVYATTQQVNDAIAWIAARNGPWFCTVAFNAPHAPFHAPPSALHTQNLTGLNPNTTPRPFYKAAIQAMDTEIGRLIAALGPAAASTSIIFIGDNGTPQDVVDAPYVRTRVKGTVYEGGVNVPMIVRGPRVVLPGREAAALVSTVDLFATMAELAGLNARSVVPAALPLDSVSLVPYLTSPSQTPLRRTVFTEIFDGSAPQAGASAMRDSRYKLIRNNGVDEVYDLAQDLLEMQNLAPVAPGSVAYGHAIGLACEIARLRGDPAGHPCTGDANCDGTVNSGDITAFVSALLSASDYVAQYDFCVLLNADANNDGLIDAADVQSFISLIL